MLPADIEMLILQLSRPQDRGDEEKAIVNEGMMPIMVFADGPDRPFLIAVRPGDLDQAFAGAHERMEGYGADRLAFRVRVFSAMSDAINTNFKYLADPSDFPNDAAILFAEALVQYGYNSASDVVPCAMRYLRSNLETPDFEEAPLDAEEPPPAEPTQPN